MKCFNVDNDGKMVVDIFWDLKLVKFNNGEMELSLEYFVVVVYD